MSRLRTLWIVLLNAQRTWAAGHGCSIRWT